MPTVSKQERVVRDATALHFWLDGGDGAGVASP